MPYSYVLTLILKVKNLLHSWATLIADNKKVFLFLHICFPKSNKTRIQYAFPDRTELAEENKVTQCYQWKNLVGPSVNSSFHHLKEERGSGCAQSLLHNTWHVGEQAVSISKLPNGPFWGVSCLTQRSFPFLIVVFLGYKPMHCGYLASHRININAYVLWEVEAHQQPPEYSLTLRHREAELRSQ